MAKDTQRSSPRKIADDRKNSNHYSRNDENYFIVYNWMTSRIKLSGNGLLVFALIYSFSNVGTKEFHGSAGYIASALNMSRRTVVSTLKSLTDNGLIKKKITGRYCNYSVPPVQNLHTSCAEIAQLSAQNLHTTCENFSHHIKDISIVDSSSGNEKITTTDKFINACKKAGFSLGRKKVAEILNSGIDPSWLSGAFTYPEYIAEAIQENYPNNPQNEKTKLFIKLLSADDRIEMFPQWRQEQVAWTANKKARNKLEAAKNKSPTKCGICGNKKLIAGYECFKCDKCGAVCYFENGKWEWKE